MTRRQARQHLGSRVQRRRHTKHSTQKLHKVKGVMRLDTARLAPKPRAKLAALMASAA